jgi:hypothetical protein
MLQGRSPVGSRERLTCVAAASSTVENFGTGISGIADWSTWEALGVAFDVPISDTTIGDQQTKWQFVVVVVVGT